MKPDRLSFGGRRIYDRVSIPKQAHQRTQEVGFLPMDAGPARSTTARATTLRNLGLAFILLAIALGVL
ncbi:MAG: hypothetical protein ABL994_17595, partial [Verrucomicrobiales bacterium]